MLAIRQHRERTVWPGEFMEGFPKEKGLLWTFLKVISVTLS